MYRGIGIGWLQISGIGIGWNQSSGIGIGIGQNFGIGTSLLTNPPKSKFLPGFGKLWNENSVFQTNLGVLFKFDPIMNKPGNPRISRDLLLNLGTNPVPKIGRGPGSRENGIPGINP